MKRIMIIGVVLGAILIVAACESEARPTLTPTPENTPAPGPSEVSEAFVLAFNAGDIQGLEDIYAKDAAFTLSNIPYGPAGAPSTETHVGAAAAIDQHLQSIEDSARVTLSEITVEGGALSARFTYIEDGVLADVGPLTGRWEAVVEASKITSLTMTLDGESYQRWKAAVAPSAALVPIAYSDETTRKDTMDQLPGPEVECIRQDLGEAAFDRFSRSLFSEDTSEPEAAALSRCLSNESLTRFFIGLAVAALGGLSDATIACMGDALSGHDMRAVFFSEGFWGEAFQAMAGCLNDQERARAEASGFFGDGGEEGPAGSPGLVDMGGRQLYLTCEGDGSPTVVMEAGGRGNSGSWHLVQPEVARFTRVCAYDRAGNGYSDSAPVLDTAQEIADELHSLLATAGFDGPYVLVGHSLGGHLVRTFANRYLNEVVGMVLVDTGHGDPDARFQAVLTPEEWQQVRAVIRHDDAGFTLPSGLDLLGPDLGDIPLVVLTAGRRSASRLPSDIVERLDKAQQDMQKELLTLSSNSTHIMAEESGHSIQSDKPELVVDAIRQVVGSARRR